MDHQRPSPAPGRRHGLGSGAEPGQAAEPRVLARAAVLLADVSDGGPVLYVHLHEVMVAALVDLGMGRDRHHRLAIADAARDHLATYLVAVGAASDAGRTSRTLHAWLVCQDLSGVQTALFRAAHWWQQQLRRGGRRERGDR